jgi:hypothetical protein
VQEVIQLIFERFRKLGGARQVMLSMSADQIGFPRPLDGKELVSFDWTPIRYRDVMSVLKNPSTPACPQWRCAARRPPGLRRSRLSRPCAAAPGIRGK